MNFAAIRLGYADNRPTKTRLLGRGSTSAGWKYSRSTPLGTSTVLASAVTLDSRSVSRAEQVTFHVKVGHHVRLNVVVRQHGALVSSVPRIGGQADRVNMDGIEGRAMCRLPHCAVHFLRLQPVDRVGIPRQEASKQQRSSSVWVSLDRDRNELDTGAEVAQLRPCCFEAGVRVGEALSEECPLNEGDDVDLVVARNLAE
jgi:hypothetical protein